MTRLNQILVLALVVQVVIIAAVSTSGEKHRVIQPTKVFEGFEPSKVTKIEILGEMGGSRAQGEAIVLEKQGASWVLPGADGYPADESKVKELLENVQKLTARGEVVTKSTYHRKLEVAGDRYQRKVTLTHDGKELGFFLGTSPSFKNIHLRKADGDDVVMVSGLTAYDVGANMKAWVDSSYVNIPKSDVWALTLEGNKKRIQLERGAGDTWALLGSQKAPKTTEVDELVRKSGSISLERPVGKAIKPEYGLEPPEYTVTLVTGTSTVAGMPPKETKVRKIAIGKKVELDEVKQYYLKSDGSDYVVTAPAWALDTLVDKQPKDLVEE